MTGDTHYTDPLDGLRKRKHDVFGGPYDEPPAARRPGQAGVGGKPSLLPVGPRLGCPGSGRKTAMADTVKGGQGGEDDDPVAYARAHVTSLGAHALLDEVERGRTRRGSPMRWRPPRLPATGPVTIDAGAICEFCDRRLVRITIRWLAAGTLSDYCEQSPTMFHRPAGTEG